MSIMLDRIAKAIELAQGNAPYYVMPQYKNKYNVFKTNPPGHADGCMMNLVSQVKAEDECERLNNLYVARMAVEALKDVPIFCYDNYKCDKMWKDLRSSDVWNLWFNAILKS